MNVYIILERIIIFFSKYCVIMLYAVDPYTTFQEDIAIQYLSYMFYFLTMYVEADGKLNI